MLSRVADNLYWISRYLERAEHTARLLGVNLDDLLDQTPQSSRRWELMYRGLGVDLTNMPADFSVVAPNRFLTDFVLDSSNPVSVLACIANARENARQVREEISSEMWLFLNRLFQRMRSATLDDIWAQTPHSFLQHRVKDGLQTFQGITDATLSHSEGWHFLQLGRYVERALNTATLLDVYFTLFDNEEDTLVPYMQDLEWIALLKSCTSFEAYCKFYTAEIAPHQVAEFLLLNEALPRSVRFCADRIQESAKEVAFLTERVKRDDVYRLAGRLSSLLDFSSIDEVLDEGLVAYCSKVKELCVQIHNTIYSRYINPQEFVLT